MFRFLDRLPIVAIFGLPRQRLAESVDQVDNTDITSIAVRHAVMNAVAYQAVVYSPMLAPGFALGLCCDEDEIHAIEFLAPRAELRPKVLLAREAVRQLNAYLKDSAFEFALPLAPAGTPFQRRVWAGIAAIPSGETRSYGALAQAIGSGPRAVGNACGSNPYPLAIPCHRVVASGGGLGGFSRERGGMLLEIKRWLLAHEDARWR